MNRDKSIKNWKWWLSCVFGKKFKVRVNYFGYCKYTVDYAHYRLIPVWRSLSFWFAPGHPGGVECWATDLFGVDEAERVAEKLKSISDVNDLYRPRLQKEIEWRAAEKKYQEKNAPYSSKHINT